MLSWDWKKPVRERERKRPLTCCEGEVLSKVFLPS